MRVVILDTGCANLASLRYAIQRLGYAAEVSADPATVRAADRLFLPGVGTAKAAMRELNGRGLAPLIRACTQPVLGICLGMQLMGKTSEEGTGEKSSSEERSTLVDLLALVDAPVRRLKSAGLPLPHMGWNICKPVDGHPLFEGLSEADYFYYVHGYAMPVGGWTIAQGDYGESFSAAFQHNNFYGVQFHPERSGQAGARLLRNFLENMMGNQS